MSDDPWPLDETPPLMPAQRARDVARAYKGLADHLASLGVRSEAQRAKRQSAWWMAYSIALAQTPPDSTG